MLHDHDEYQSHNWFRSPSWRVEVAVCSANNQGSNDPDRRAILAALDIYENGGAVKSEIEARILASESDSDIAARFKLDAATIAAYEMFCFNVRESLRARDWILARVIGKTFHVGDHAQIWRYFAYYGGPHVLELVLAVTRNQPFPSSVTADFRIDPVYEEARLRLIVRLNIAILQATTYAELIQLLKVYETAQATEQSRTDVPAILKDDLRKHREFLRFASRTRSSKVVSLSGQEAAQEPDPYRAPPTATPHDPSDQQRIQTRSNPWPLRDKVRTILLT